MKAGTDVLDQLAPALVWEGDWADVLERARERSVHPRRSRLPSKRRLLVLLALLAAVLVPLAALGAVNGWWFFRAGSAPAPANAPVVVREGVWSGRAWQLIAYRSRTDGICFSLTPKGSEATGSSSALTCAPLVGVPRTADTKGSADLTITFLSGAASNLLPAYVVGPVVEEATSVEIRFVNEEVLRVPTFEAPTSIGDVRFYAAQLSRSAGSRAASRVERLTGFDDAGNVVACLVPRTLDNSGPSLADCRRPVG
jgi:hypothetical protein